MISRIVHCHGPSKLANIQHSAPGRMQITTIVPRRNFRNADMASGKRHRVSSAASAVQEAESAPSTSQFIQVHSWIPVFDL